jgi:hypothetical protein
MSRDTNSLGDSEVGYMRMALSEQNVFRLDVSVNKPVPMSVVQRVCHLTSDAASFL